MEIIVFTNDVGKKELLQKKSMVDYTFVSSMQELLTYKQADAFFILTDQYSVDDLHLLPLIPVFIHSVNNTLSGLALATNFVRVNAWATFLQLVNWEVVGYEKYIKKIFDVLGWKYTLIADAVGMVSARIVAMIINEAYFAIGENISTKEEMDIAMRYGTNYPYGPFEWAARIGIKNIASLLESLVKNNEVYVIAPILQHELETSLQQ